MSGLRCRSMERRPYRLRSSAATSPCRSATVTVSFWVVDQPERINRGHALAERQQDAPVSVARERQPTVGDPQPRWSGGPVKPVRASNRYAGDVGTRCPQPPGTVLGDEVLVVDLHPGALGCDPERSRRAAIGESEAEIEALHRASGYAP